MITSTHGTRPSSDHGARDPGAHVCPVVREPLATVIPDAVRASPQARVLGAAHRGEPSRPAAALPDAVRAFRERHRAEHIGPRYRGWAHFLTTSIGAATAIGVAAWQIDAPGVGELALVPLFFLFANLVEYFGHRGPMHHRRRGLRLLFERHSLQHHAFYTHEAMEAESSRDFQMVLFPPIMLGFFLGGVGPVAALLGWITTANIGWLFLLTGTAYFLTYEWLHWAYHQPATSWIGRNAVVARLRRHHLVHHDPRRMTRVNFNVTFPIGDRLFGTTAH